jgi:hypothetical protein
MKTRIRNGGMKNARFFSTLALLFLTFLAACSSPAPTTSSTENKTAETKPAYQPSFSTGREALQQMYVAARSWAPDAKPYSLHSFPTKDNNGQDGKAGLWSAGFASASRRAIKVFSWSGIKTEDSEPGISSKPEDTYNPANTSTAAFDMAFLKADSDAVIKTALKHGGDKVLAKNKDYDVYYSVSWLPRENKLVWRMVFGEVENEPKLAIDVDASTGEFIKVEK